MILQALNLTKQYFRKREGSNVFDAVRDVSLKPESGRITAITGPSGSGKTTLLNMLAGILAPTSGSVEADGRDIYTMPDEELSRFRNEHIGVVPQGQTAIGALTVLDNVLLPFLLYQRGGDEYAAAETRARGFLEETGIGDLADVMPSELSGGELRRMAVSRAMLMQPELILADEPTADLDDENSKIVLQMMRRAAEEGSAVIIVTHDPAVLPWADAVYSMKKGVLSESEN